MGEKEYFCYVDVQTLPDMITVCSLLLLSCVLLGKAARKYYRLRGQHNPAVAKVYTFILTWWMTYLFKDLYALMLYWLKSTVGSQTLSSVSKGYFALDWANAFVLQWLLLYVPYHWMKKIYEIFTLDRNSGDMEVLAYNTERKYSLVIGIYMKLRALAVIPLILFLSLQDTETIQIFYKTLMWLLLLDCVIIVAAMSIGIHSLRANQALQQLDLDQAKRMLNQYIIIIVATLIRFSADASMTIAVVFTNSLSSKDCGSVNEFNVWSLLFIVSVCLFTHYLPIFVVLRIYTLTEKPADLSKSLLGQSSDNLQQ